MLNFGICDDDIFQCEYFKKILKKSLNDKNIKYNDIFITDNQNEIFSKILDKEINVLFLDIDFKDKGQNGINFAKKLRSINNDFYLIFLTGDMRYMPLSFENKTFDYLLKPISVELLTLLLDRLINEFNSVNTSNFLKLNDKIIINYNSIIYIEKTNNKSEIHTTTGTYTINKTLNSLLNILPNNFKRCHRSYIANTNFISIYDKSNSKIIFTNNDTCFTNSKFNLEGVK